MRSNVYTVADQWLRIVSEDFFGPCVRAPLGDYAVAWENARLDRASGKVTRPGRWFLLNDGKIAIRGRTRRVLCAAVSNPGTFLIACGPRDPGELTGTVYVSEPDGSVLIKERIDALPGPGAIADDGSHGVCQATLGRPGSADAGRLIVFDVERRAVTARIEPAAGWPGRLEIDAEQRRIIAGHGAGDRDGVRHYDLDGNREDAASGGSTPPGCVTELKPRLKSADRLTDQSASGQRRTSGSRTRTL